MVWVFSRTGGYRVGIAASVQQEILVLHVREPFRVEGHADKVEVGVEAVDLEGILDVVGGRAVAVVVGVLCRRPRAPGVHGRQGIAAQDIGGIAFRARDRSAVAEAQYRGRPAETRFCRGRT